MKTSKQLPKTVEQKEHFNKYAKVIKRLFYLSLFAQLVSIGTEWAIINGLISNSLAKYIPNLASPISITITIFAIVSLEGGLRVLLPVGIQAILYKRFKGLEAVFSIFALVMCIGLLAISISLSFKGSTQIAKLVVKEPKLITTDSVKLETNQALQALILEQTRKADNLKQLSNSNSDLIKAEYSAKVQAEKTKLQTYRTKQANTGQSYTTRIQKQKERISELQAEQNTKLAALNLKLTNQLQDLEETFTKQKAKAQGKLETAQSKAEADNIALTTEADNKRRAGGGLLGWFTVLCLALLVVYTVLDESFKKLSNTHELIEVSDSYFRESFFKSFFGALGTGLDVNARRVVAWIEQKTPEYPEPVAPFTLYDREGIKQQVSEAQPMPRRKVGFKVGFTEHENTHQTPPEILPLIAPKETPEEHENTFTKGEEFKAVKGDAYQQAKYELYNAIQKKNMYAKRTAKHKQNAKVQERKEGAAKQRTLAAIENNGQHFDKWTAEVKRLNDELKKIK